MIAGGVGMQFLIWWRRVLGAPAPVEASATAEAGMHAVIPAERLALIDTLRDRQHDQANQLTALTGQAYITAHLAHRVTDHEAREALS